MAGRCCSIAAAGAAGGRQFDDEKLIIIINLLRLNLTMLRGAIVENIVFNPFAKFNDDRH